MRRNESNGFWWWVSDGDGVEEAVRGGFDGVAVRPGEDGK